MSLVKIPQCLIIESSIKIYIRGRFAKLGDLEKVQECLRTPGSNINWRNPDSQSDMHPGGETCLMRAAASGKNLVLQVSFLIFLSCKLMYLVIRPE